MLNSESFLYEFFFLKYYQKMFFTSNNSLPEYCGTRFLGFKEWCSIYTKRRTNKNYIELISGLLDISLELNNC